MAPLGALSPLHLGLDLRTPPVGRCVGPQFSKVVDDCVRRLGELSNAVSAPLARQVGSEHLGAELVGGQELRLRVEVSVGAAGGRGPVPTWSATHARTSSHLKRSSSDHRDQNPSRPKAST